MAKLEQKRESMSGHPPGSFEWEVVHKEEDGNAGTIDTYLKLAEECVEAVERMSPRNFNEQQCDYLAKKLNVVVQSASSYLEMIRHRPCSFTDTDRHVASFKHLVSLACQIESFIQGCYDGAWIQATLMLANVPEYVSSLGFNLELCRVSFSAATERLSSDQVDDINNGEVGLVKEKASVDLDALVDKVILEMPSLGNESKDLAIYVLHRLRAIKPVPGSQFPGSSSRKTNDVGSYLRKLKKTNDVLRELFLGVRQTARLRNVPSGSIDRAMWLGMPVAVKTFYGPEDLSFKREAEILASLCHPNVTSMFCSATDTRKCSIVMELMDMDLRNLIDQRLGGNNDSPPFTISEAVDIMHQIIEGVCYLHGKGVEHRDLKSHNILVKLGVRDSKTTYVHVKVADFGLSKVKENSVRLSIYTSNIGTNRWMAPELINIATPDVQGLRKKFPFQSDMYSFAMICYEILTGEIPFSTTQLSLIRKMVVEGVRPELPAHCPYALKALIERCWSHLPEDRPLSAVVCSELKYLKYMLLTDHVHPAVAPSSAINYPQKPIDSGFFERKNTFEVLLAADNMDLFVIKKADTCSNFIEIHILSSESNYQSYSLHASIPIPLQPDHTTWTFCLATNRNLFGIKRIHTGTKSTEVHILTKESNYQVFSLQTGTGLHETDGTWQFMVSRGNDLYIVKKQQTGSNSTEIHALTASSNYQRFGLNSRSGVPETGLEWDFFGLDSMNNVYAIKKTGAAPELYILKSVSGYLDVVNLELLIIDPKWYAFLLGPQVINSCDLFIIKKSYNSSRFMEVQVASAQSNYTELKAEFWSSPSEEPIGNEEVPTWNVRAEA